MLILNDLLNAPKITPPVKCLGITFNNDEARRAHFLELLRKKLQGIDFKSIYGFPLATDEAILALSDPPYYTVCPNPWLADFLTEWGAGREKSDNYHREPFATDVIEGKKDPIYNAHAYHTKVPHKAIMRYILHYTEPGDVVFDGFCGTGMGGVAAQLCGDKQAVEALGYRVQLDGTIESLEEEGDKSLWKAFSKLGARRTILNDLSPAATFIAYNYNTPIDAIAFEQEAQRLLQAVEAECAWMYQTLHSSSKAVKEYAEPIQSVILGEMDCPAWLTLGRVNYTVYSDVFVCPECTNEIVFSAAAVNKETKKVKKQFPCPHCDTTLTKRLLERAWFTRFDTAINKTIQQAKQVPVLINYSVGKMCFEKTPDKFDLALLEKIESSDVPYWFPMDRMMAGGETRRNDKIGITHVHHFYTKRALITLGFGYQYVHSLDDNIKHYLLFMIQQAVLGMAKIARYVPTHYSQVNQYLSGTLYIGSQVVDVSLEYIIEGKIKRLSQLLGTYNKTSETLIACQHFSDFKMAEAVMDYIFLDPPFGSNLMYSELNFLWEAWLQVFTNNQSEAIINKTQGKNLGDYRTLMVACFKEAFRLLKPGRWMTVVFSNTQARVWNTLQTTLQAAGFIIANVSALDKKQGSFKAVTTTTAVKQDLIISAYKPNIGLEERFDKAGGSEAGVWEFVGNHLKYLPVTKMKDGELAFIAERDPRILYDRTVAYFIGHGYPVPLSSQQFQAGLQTHFKECDGMIFRLEQIESYEEKRKVAKTLPQMLLFVSDERSAIDWLQNFLKKRPSTRQDIHPEWIKLIGAGWKKYEPMMELDTLLAFNFLKYEGKGAVPSQIHGYLSHQYKDCRNLEKNDPILQKCAAERWYVPDPHKAQDLEKIREVHLLREFKQYRTQKRLKSFRLEAMRLGFKQAWAQKAYNTIIEMAEKMPEAALYEDDKLLQLYDLALVRLETLPVS